MPVIGAIGGGVLTALGVGAAIYQGVSAASSASNARAQAMADQARAQKAADARQPNTAAIMAAAQGKVGSSSGTNITAGTAGAPPLGGGSTLLGGGG